MSDEGGFVDHYAVLGLDAAIDAEALPPSGAAAAGGGGSGPWPGDGGGGSARRAEATGTATTTLPSARDISKAYRRLALRLHPDKLVHQKLSQSALAAAADRFEAISRAHTLLQDESERAKFDAERKRRFAERARVAAQTAKTRAMEQELLERERAADELRMRQRQGAARRQSALQWAQERDRETKRRLWEELNAPIDHASDDGQEYDAESVDIGKYRDILLTREEEILRALCTNEL